MLPGINQVGKCYYVGIIPRETAAVGAHPPKRLASRGSSRLHGAPQWYLGVRVPRAVPIEVAFLVALAAVALYALNRKA